MASPPTNLVVILCLLAFGSIAKAATWELDARYMTGNQGVNERVYALGLDSAKRLIAGGLFTSAEGSSSRGLARFFQDGALDPSFNIGTRARPSDE